MGDYANGIEGGSSHTTEKIGGGINKVMSMSNAGTRKVQRAQELRERNEENTMNAATDMMEVVLEMINLLKSPGNKPKTNTK
jgi:hypothetical protein